MSNFKTLPTQTNKNNATPPLKGDIAPSTHKLMSVRNVGGIHTDYFKMSPFDFVREAVSLLEQPPVSLNRKNELSAAKPNSIKYRQLVYEMLKKGLVEKIPPNKQREETLVLFSLFAVVKDETGKTARPIENAHTLSETMSTGVDAP